MKPVKDIYKNIAKKYTETYSDKEYPTDKYVDQFVSMMPKEARILDAGCGDASYTDIFLSKGFSVEGIDISEEMIKIARKKFPKANFKIGDLRKVNLKEKIYDGILCMQGTCHIAKKYHDHILKEFYKGLKEDGILFLTVQEGEGEGLTYWPLAGTEIFTSHYQLDEIKEKLTSIGFNIIFTDIYSPCKGDYQNNKLAIMARK
ncbi:MAG: class I SAM-dependent methyltransferase [Nanoarchaeota archaeon]|nr:class I SAM-dependent methyltransferase [Nanoarchaeota archaeon]MBU1135639.1 class I SAM-dependent methyltransferase [Nanoarchaeota archaeon]MBU2520004.1 class I SAM-dependent methyltransferase [Nanoarchaeota archaeon]